LLNYDDIKTGPDHLAALIAPTVGKSGFNGIKVGALWGVGHGITAIFLGMSVFFVKGQFTGHFAIMEKLSTVAESVVGLSILFIGLMGIKESREAQAELREHRQRHELLHSQLYRFDNDSFVVPPGGYNGSLVIPQETITQKTTGGKRAAKTRRAIFTNGLLHGFSWDGAPSLAPALTMSSWRGALSFLVAYSLGTIVAMSMAAGTLGELSSRVGKASNNPDLPHKLSFISSMVAVGIGLYLTSKSAFFHR
jgi:ABC-type nickel/cobalt efflux system permease component RcnA